MSDFPIRIWVFTHKGTACKIRLADEESALALQSMIGASFESDWILEVVNPRLKSQSRFFICQTNFAGCAFVRKHPNTNRKIAHFLPQLY
jgi:hypothetical protein